MAPTAASELMVPEVKAVFYNFSHEHHGSIRIKNTQWLRGVTVTVRETVMEQIVFDHELDSSEISRGFYELPVLSTGDVYMENMEAYDALGAWPTFEMKIAYRYENESEEREESGEISLDPAHETGYGVSYWGPDYTWDDQLPPDSFIIAPWDEVEHIRYVFDSPDSVQDGETVYVDVDYDGRHLAPEEYEAILKKDEYSIFDPQTGQETPVISYTSELVIPRPDWMPESGTIHITIVQKLLSTGELYFQTIDLDFP